MAKKAAKKSQKIYRTRGELAAAFGVSARTVSIWLGAADFPGRSGNPFCRDGHFPDAEIREWLEDRKKRTKSESQGTLDEARQKSIVTKTEIDELKLQERRGELVELSVVKRELARAVTVARQSLAALPETMIRMMPADTDQRIVDDLRLSLQRVVDGACDSVATAMEADE